MNKIKVYVIRPIDPKDDYKPNHFQYLESLLKKWILDLSDKENSFEFKGLVSESSGVTDINHSIVKNIFDADIVIAITSGLNSNVMFELGLSLSQPKPTIIISDDKTSIPFDLNSFYTISYPKNLAQDEMDIFQSEFKNKLIGTWDNFTEHGAKNTYINQYQDATIINTNINEVDLNEAVQNLAYMIDVMKKKYVAIDDTDIWDDFNFDHDVAVTRK
ncbi:hypothetical protein RD055328_10440 [Companilactobacillus sp. RD055328]|uniref:hypothetical protein n=1 Tax=Companilactobacillus sp. RD055328 TaxID=2916634 RepID=UPI001FC8754D|nr:hypothetical protein [Companilactobacillus sp. RD055328]GKQ43121.1 hypothetical protein RD055328_10440 [Companilactobacillus sp. RD055328]